MKKRQKSKESDEKKSHPEKKEKKLYSTELSSLSRSKNLGFYTHELSVLFHNVLCFCPRFF